MGYKSKICVLAHGDMFVRSNMKLLRNKKIVLFGLLCLVLVIGAVFVQLQSIAAKKVHFHAGFQVYKDGKQVSFSDTKYMHEKPCTDDPQEEHKEDEQIEKAHLYGFVGDVVHVHRENVKWNDLFINLSYSIPQDAQTYLNGKKVDTLFQTEIQPYNSIVIFIGKTDDLEDLLKKAVTKQYIQEEEKHSEDCGT